MDNNWSLEEFENIHFEEFFKQEYEGAEILLWMEDDTYRYNLSFEQFMTMAKWMKLELPRGRCNKKRN
jgi:hypothetical protein